jgi:uracil-DNA glycosylase family 4
MPSATAPSPSPHARPTPARAIPAPPAPSSGPLASLRREIAACRLCPLHATRRRACPGEGPERAAVMIIGEAPGREEDRQGRPFVGPAGRLLTDALEAAGIPRRRVYITNVVKCLPPSDGGSAAPPREAVAACLRHLGREIAAVQPHIVVLAGATAARTLLDPSASITRLRGTVHFPGEWGAWVYPVCHPAYVLRAGPGSRAEREFREDIAALPRIIRVHAATLARPWALGPIAAHLFTSAPVPHEPSPHSPARAWMVLDRFSLPETDGDRVAWDLRGLRPMWRTPSAVAELLRRYTGEEVELDLPLGEEARGWIRRRAPREDAHA